MAETKKEKQARLLKLMGGPSPVRQEIRDFDAGLRVGGKREKKPEKTPGQIKAEIAARKKRQRETASGIMAIEIELQTGGRNPIQQIGSQ